MKKLVIILVVFFIVQTVVGQNNIDFSFKMDYAAEQFFNKLKDNNVDTIISAFYCFNNGRGRNASKIFIWKKEGRILMKVIKIKKKDKFKEFKEEEISTDSIFTYYLINRIDTVSSQPKELYRLSHDYCYYIDILIDTSKSRCSVCNFERITDLTHPKSIWVEMIDNLVRDKYYK